MFFKSSVYLLVSTFVPFLINYSFSTVSKRLKRQTNDYAPKCVVQNTPLDQSYNFAQNNNTPTSRSKRFVLFPEFELFLNDYRYVNRTYDMSYWISNFYPDRLRTDYIHLCLENIMNQISQVIDQPIIPERAADPGKANFHFVFFDYTKCPTDPGSGATVDGVQALEKLYIYSKDLTRENRYRAHGGIHIEEDDSLISEIKFNMQQTFLEVADWIYDPVVYTCDDKENLCDIDAHYVLFHETLHGFGIEVELFCRFIF